MIAAGLVMALTLAGAVIAVGARSMVHAIFGLMIALIGVAFAFGLLNSPFVAAMEVLIYIGGITVAMVFAVMLSSAGRKEPDGEARRHTFAAIAVIVFLAGVGYVIINTGFDASTQAPTGDWSVQEIGRRLLNEFNVVFELLSVVLLLAIIGAITIAARSDDSQDPALPSDAEEGGA